MPRIVRPAAGLALVSLVLFLAACGPKPVVFTPTACLAEPCGAPVRLIADYANPAPDYPEIMATVGIDGRVEVEFVVTTAGTVDTASVMIRSSTNKSFEGNTMRAIDRWRFHASGGIAITEPTAYRVAVRYVIGKLQCPGPRVRTAGVSWSMDDGQPVLTVVSCAPPLVPRNQIRPLGRPPGR